MREDWADECHVSETLIPVVTGLLHAMERVTEVYPPPAV